MRLKLSNLWACACPCSPQEILKVEGEKLGRRRRKKKEKEKWTNEINNLTCPSAEWTRALRQWALTLSRWAVTLLCTVGGVEGGALQPEQQHLRVCCRCGTSSSVPPLLPSSSSWRICITADFYVSMLFFSGSITPSLRLRLRRWWLWGCDPRLFLWLVVLVSAW